MPFGRVCGFIDAEFERNKFYEGRLLRGIAGDCMKLKIPGEKVAGEAKKLLQGSGYEATNSAK